MICGDIRLTYRDLDERANQLAHYLRKQGVGPETLLALCLDRSAEMIVALLSVLKAGGAYLPMDSEHPGERLGFMMEDAGVSHLITTRGLMDCVPTKVPSLILLDADGESIAAEPMTTPAHTTSPNHIAYCIYTSGSTGKPKGVLGAQDGRGKRNHSPRARGRQGDLDVPWRILRAAAQSLTTMSQGKRSAGEEPAIAA